MANTLSLSLLLGNGFSFLVGVGLILFSAFLAVFVTKAVWAILARVILIGGACLVAASATPVPLWFYGLWVIPILWLLFRVKSDSAAEAWYMQPAAFIVITMCLAALILEAPFHIPPTVGALPGSTVVVLGDALAVSDTGGPSWPSILKTEGQFDVVDLSEAGLTLEKALPKAQSLPSQVPGGAVVIVEVGFEDVLARTPPAKFQSDLDAVLSAVCVPVNSVLLVELPLPPFANDYGRAQRLLAEKYGAQIIPKRIVSGVLSAPGARTSGLSLTQIGHEKMAEKMRIIIAGAGSPV